MAHISKKKFLEIVIGSFNLSDKDKAIVRQSNIEGPSYAKTDAFSNTKDLRNFSMNTGKKYFLSPQTFRGIKPNENSVRKAFAVVLQVNLLQGHNPVDSEKLIARLSISENKAHKPAVVVFSSNTLEFWWLIVPFSIEEEADKTFWQDYKLLLAQVVENALKASPEILTAIINQGVLANFAFGFRVPTAEEATKKKDDIAYFRELSKNYYFKSDIQSLLNNPGDLKTFKIKFPTRCEYAEQLLEFVIALQELRKSQDNGNHKVKISFARFALEKELFGEEFAVESLQNHVAKSNRKNWHDPTPDIIFEAQKQKYEYTDEGVVRNLKPTPDELAQLMPLPIWFSKKKKLTPAKRQDLAVQYWEKGYSIVEIAERLKTSEKSVRRYLGKIEITSKTEVRTTRILELHNLGFKQNEIAEKLEISQNTVSLHLKQEREKSLCHN